MLSIISINEYYNLVVIASDTLFAKFLVKILFQAFDSRNRISTRIQDVCSFSHERQSPDLVLDSAFIFYLSLKINLFGSCKL